MDDWMENKDEQEKMVRRILREYSDRAGDAAAVRGLLDEVGAHYGAQRVYLAEGNAASADVLTAPIGADGWLCVEGATRGAGDTLVLCTAAGVLSGWRAAERRLQLASRAMEDQNRIIRSLGGIYTSMYYIDLWTGQFVECTSVDVVHDHIGAAGDAQDRLNYFCRQMMLPDDAAEMLAFVDLTTLEARMAHTRIVTKQYRSTIFMAPESGSATTWRECSFIESDRDADGRLAHVIFTTQSIHEAKKRELEAQQRLVDTNVDLTALLAEEKQHTAIISSLSNIYFALFYIDLAENSYQEVISLRDQPFKLEEKTDARVALQHLAEELAEAAYRPAMRSFTDFDTLGQRLGDKSMIIQEFMAQSGGWARCGFVPVERDETGRNRTVLCTLRWITGEKEERALQENLVQALALPYDNIYAVDVDTGEAVCCRMGQTINDRYGEEFAIGSYEQNTRIYVRNDVLREDWPLFEKAGTVRGACELLRERESYAFTYRVARNGRVEYFQCQLVMPDRRRNKFVVAFKNVDEQMAREQAQQRKVEEALAAVEKVNASLEEEMAVSDALSQEYSSLFKIDAKTGRMSLYRTDGVGISAELLGRLMALGDYETVLSKYIDVFVMPEDRARLRESSALPVLRERVPEVGLYKQGYRRMMNGVVSYYEMNVVRTHGSAGETTFILGMRDVDEEMRRQLRQTREMEVQREIIQGLGSEYYSVLLVDPREDTVEVYRAEEEDGRAIERYIYKQDKCWSRVIRGYAQELVSDASREEFREKLSLDHIKADGKDYSFTYEKLTERGIIYLQARVSFVHEKDGGLVAVVGTRNVDDLIKKEREQETALQLAFDAAEAANRAKTDFLSNMSHDIRTPMNGIIGMTAIAAAHIDDRERVQDSLQKITQASKHLLSLINEVLDMSKIESGKVDLIEEAFNLADLVDNLLTMTSAQVEAHRHELSVNIAGVTHEAVVGDSLRIQKVFTNLMGNAVKFTPDGGKIQLSITEKPSNQAKVGCFEFVFEDNGIGMSEEFVEKVFEPFSRAEDEQVHHIQGTGLGMSISRNIVRMMGGDIKVESELGKGPCPARSPP
ncbi:MAG: sensor histidine kinase, partial [Candidatus Spyradocola sp.]